MVSKPSAFPESINPELSGEDFLYHFWFNRLGIGLNGVFQWMTLKKAFWDVTHVCMGWSPERAQRFANTLHREINPDSERSPVEPIWKNDRFSLFKVGTVISVSHGMGMPSMSILLHEITKILYYAKGCDEQKLRDEVKFIRIGTSGWVGVEAWTVVITENWVNAKWERKHTETVLGKDFDFPTNLNTALISEIQAANIVDDVGKEIQLVLWDTVGTDCFYEGQGRRDGVFTPGYSEKEKQEWLKQLHKKWVRNFEMEATYFASFCLRAGIPAAIVCVALLNRFQGDQVNIPDWIWENAEMIILNYLRRVWALI